MRALQCIRMGSIENLRLNEVADPIPGEGEVLVDLKAAGINFPDLLIIQGLYQVKPPLPFTPGGEAAGVISALGDGVKHFNVGDRVICSMLTGAFAEKAVLKAQSVIPMPDSMSYAQGAGFTTTYSTSYHALVQRANIQPGEKMLVLGAAGGVGLTAVELGKVMGAEVIAAASTEEKLDTACVYGADHRINYTTENLKQRLKEITEGKGVDVVYDPVGGDLSEQALRGTGYNGRFLVIGFASGSIPKIPINLCLLKSNQIVGVFWGSWAGMFPDQQRDNYKALLDLFVAGKLNPLVSQSYDLAEYREAFDCLSQRRARGKVILRNTD